ncbi:E3 ubiquitin-protein ligase-like protein bre1 [Lepidopterella palustris CBS 459.81]|uniref:E3 ubiquitin protein ligase n=1 Tax=Lepidopterella palustris CBS 459.81 TaxID=1314670 RepID=A0A8E2JCE5_9PEZI|nr:E3 ubiquitin-protein ligase-like protein bre1 [Lepidopterella palustris CBS 459.81]
MRLEARTVIVPSLDVVKMEDRKRPAMPDHDDAAPPAKRQAVTVNGAKSHPDADLPWKDDIESFQKDAILRQMREYKREKVALEAQVAEMEKRSAFHDDHLRTIDVWFSQLIDEVKILANDTLSLGNSQTAGDAPFPSSLLFADNETFQKHLASRSQSIKSALSALFAKIPAASPEVGQLQEQVSRLLAMEKEHIAQLHQITTEKEQLSERMDSATHRYMIAEKKLDRTKSVQVAKLEKQATQSSVRDDMLSVKQEGSAEINGVKGGVRINEELETARREAIAEATKRKEQLEQLEAENKKLTEQLTALTIRLNGLSDDDYAKTDLFKVLKSQHEDVIKRINNLEATNVQLREEAQKLQAERTAYRIQIDEENRLILSESESSLAQAEANVTRIRNVRDELSAEIAMRKTDQEQKKASVDQIKELASARESRIAALESEVERLRQQITEQELSEEQQNAELNDMTPEQLRSKITSLESQYKLLSNELPSMEAAWKKAQSVAAKKIADLAAWEETIARANADKMKADQKFFGAMKTKEAREVENRTLRIQITKSAEIITQLKEAEALNRGLADKLEKQLAEMRGQMDELSIQHRALQQKLNEYQITSEGHTTQITELKKTLAAKDTSYLAASHAQREAEVEREKLKVQLEDAQKQSESWKKKSLSNQSDEDKHMRAMLLCAVCKKNFKDTAIKSCGHLFCAECVNERLTSRSRKCPQCGKSFGSNDHMKVHF